MISLKVWRILVVAQMREQPGRLLVTVFAIALGVSLGASVFLVNGTALDEFTAATRRLVGEADVIVRGPRAGFDEALYVRLARDPEVAAASPVLEVDAAVTGQREPLRLLAVDPFRAAAIQPALFAELAGKVLTLFKADSVYLSASAAQQLRVRRGETFEVTIGDSARPLRVAGILSSAAYPQPLGIMDIASAQWAFDRLGRLNRIDLRTRAGTPVEAFRARLARTLPEGILAVTPQIERDRAVTVTRAYRVNLNMLALVALWTGAFLVFSTQSLSVLRRRRSLALLRALGVTRGELQRGLIGEGLALGVLGSSIGVGLGVLFAAAMLRLLTGDLGNGQLRAAGASLHFSGLPLLFFFLVGTAVAAVGAWMPARTAAQLPPARALKGGDGDYRTFAAAGWRLGSVFLACGTLLAMLPAVQGLPIFGYAAIASLLLGAVLLVPTATVQILKRLPRTDRVVWDVAVAQLRENVGISALSLASIIVSFSLMVAMAIMVYSFRVSFDHWLAKLLPADLQIREPLGNDTAYWPAVEQAKLAALRGVGRFEFRRTQQLLLDGSRPPVALIARGADARQIAEDLPLVQSAAPSSADRLRPVWISEALQDLYRLKLGGELELPVGGHARTYRIAGIWRDYARTSGAVVMSRPDYIEATGDGSANEGSAWLDGAATPASVVAEIRASLARG
ncbi:MAG: ABC transporter permease, partial [Pseudomonadota bacterium]|nr:ABC transporter permease [Pseudomonadota bacterium]